MRPELSPRPFVLASPGDSGWENPRPVCPGTAGSVRETGPGCARPASLTLFFPGDVPLSPGDVLFSPDDLSRPRWLIRRVSAFPSHLEALAEAFPEAFPADGEALT